MADEELNPATSQCLHLFSAFLAMEPSDSLIELARVCDEGSVSERVQRFIWSHCISKVEGKFHAPYLKNFLKKLISEAEKNCCNVLDEIYEQYAFYMTSLKDEVSMGETKRVNKCISFLFPDGYPKWRKLLIQLQCSLNMLEGDTGCSVWPSSLYLSECILSYPELFCNKSCFEVGSGVGLVGITLSHVKASEVLLSDGDVLTLANMKVNLELNQLNQNKVKCIHLPWESATKEQLQSFKPDIILAADVIYDPVCLPHLVRVVATLLNHTKKSYSEEEEVNNCQGSLMGETQGNLGLWRKGPVALIASVIRTIDTFNYFLELVDKANLSITDITQTLKPVNLLPYMKSYNRSSISLFIVSSK
ncbi:hypothetical protein CsatA_027527 [Cannabis sativa]